jgi:hypothetical protein
MNELQPQVTAQLAAELTKALSYGLRRPEKRVAVFTAFSDESGGPNARDTFLLGGYFASVDNWGHFSSVWAEQVLNAKPTIPYVHMVELRREAFKKQYGLSDWDAMHKVRDAVRIIACTAGLSAIVTRMDRSELQEASTRS